MNPSVCEASENRLIVEKPWYFSIAENVIKVGCRDERCQYWYRCILSQTKIAKHLLIYNQGTCLTEDRTSVSSLSALVLIHVEIQQCN